MLNSNVYQFQWAVVRDTNLVGSQFSEKIVFLELCKDWSDYGNLLYSTNIIMEYKNVNKIVDLKVL